MSELDPNQPGVAFQIGGNLDPLGRALADAEARFQRTQREADKVARDIAKSHLDAAKTIQAAFQQMENEISAVTRSSTEHRISLLMQEGEKRHAWIAENVSDRKTAEALMLQNAKAIEAQITAVQQQEAQKQSAIARASSRLPPAKRSTCRGTPSPA